MRVEARKYKAFAKGRLVGQFDAETAEKMAALPAYRGITWLPIPELPIPKDVKKAAKAEDKTATKKAVTQNEHTNEPSPADGQDQRGAGGPAE